MTQDMQTCSRCSAENATEAKFCSHCGNALGVASEAPPPPPPSSPPPSPISSGFGAKDRFRSNSDFGGSKGRSGNTRSIDLPATPDLMLAAFAQAITENGGEILEKTQNQIFFNTPYKNNWHTAGTTVKLDGEVRIMPGEQGGSHVTLTITVNINSMIPLFALTIIIGLLFFGFGIILGGLLAAVDYYYLNTNISERLARLITQQATEVAQAGQVSGSSSGPTAAGG